MHIFIDETGTFTGIGQPLSISMIGALIVPDGRLRSLEREYGKIRKYLPTEHCEVKGKRLSEKDIAKLMPILQASLFSKMTSRLPGHSPHSDRR